jgi:hypothetical protein
MALLGCGLGLLQAPILVLFPQYPKLIHTGLVQVIYGIIRYNNVVTPTNSKELIFMVGVYWVTRSIISLIRNRTNFPVVKTVNDMTKKTDNPAWVIALIGAGIAEIALFGLCISLDLTSDAISSGILAIHVAFTQ